MRAQYGAERVGPAARPAPAADLVTYLRGELSRTEQALAAAEEREAAAIRQ
ncbi:hypothetical protein GCM10017750_68460 [Streptomyces racemochromogenes]